MSDLRISGIVKRFGQVTAVDGVDVHVAQGHLLSLLGPSGCGKTTLLRMIAGLEQPDAGTLAIGGEDITDVPVNQRGIGMVFQSYALFPNMTAAENIGYGLRLRKWSKDRIASRVGEMVDLIQIGDASKRYPHQMSGGQQQRVALARALAIEPRVLLLDEPLSALDAQVRVALREGIRTIQQQLGITSVYVTHDQEEALSISDEVVVMRAGRIEQAGPPEELYGRPATPFVASFVGAANRLPATVTDRAAGIVRWGPAVLRMADLGKGATLDHILVVVRPERIGVERLADGDTSSAGGRRDRWRGGAAPVPGRRVAAPGADERRRCRGGCPDRPGATGARRPGPADLPARCLHRAGRRACRCPGARGADGGRRARGPRRRLR